MENELISVVVPVYNVEKNIRKCLDSLINQTYKNIEIIVVDDGTPDLSGKIAEQYAEQDARIKVLHKENGGLSDARNKGIDLAQGTYITFIDSDDFVSSDYVEYLYTLIKKYNVKMASSFYQMIVSEDEVMIDKNGQEYLLTPREAIEKMLYRNEISHNAWGKLYHRELFEQKPTLKFNGIFEDERYKQFNPIQKEQYRFPVGIINEDLALIYYLALECPQIAQGTRKTYYYFSNPTSITKSKVKETDFTIFALYKALSEVILQKYPDLSDAILEFKGTIYVKLYKRLVLKQRNDFNEVQKYIKDEIKLMTKGLMGKKVRKPTKIRLFSAAFSKRLFIILCNFENLLGAKS